MSTGRSGSPRDYDTRSLPGVQPKGMSSAASLHTNALHSAPQRRPRKLPLPVHLDHRSSFPTVWESAAALGSAIELLARRRRVGSYNSSYSDGSYSSDHSDAATGPGRLAGMCAFCGSSLSANPSRSVDAAPVATPGPEDELDTRGPQHLKPNQPSWSLSTPPHTSLLQSSPALLAPCVPAPSWPLNEGSGRPSFRPPGQPAGGGALLPPSRQPAAPALRDGSISSSTLAGSTLRLYEGFRRQRSGPVTVRLCQPGGVSRVTDI